jgi:hypothetical protein
LEKTKQKGKMVKIEPDEKQYYSNKLPKYEKVVVEQYFQGDDLYE